MTKRRSRKRNVVVAGYEQLECRQMLATLFMGTQGEDVVDISFAGDNRVDIQINDVIHENVDSAEGIRLNLRGGDDRVEIDHRILDELVIINGEELSFTGEDSTWYVGFNQQLVLEGNNTTNGTVVGRINENVRFAGVSRILTGNGNDTFNMSTETWYPLDIHAGGGDDLFRFLGEQRTVPNTFLFFQQLNAHGQAGNDRFVFRGIGAGNAYGGDGYDVIDSRLGTVGIDQYFSGSDSRKNPSIEKIIGAVDSENTIRIANDSFGERYELEVDGDVSILRELNSGRSVELINLDEFRGGSRSNDRVWIFGTNDDIKIVNADFVQLSSEIDANVGNLDRIQHDVLIERGTYISPSYGSSLVMPFIYDLDGVTNPLVVASDRSGDGVVASFGPNQTISGLIGGSLKFYDAGKGFNTDPFAPELVIHGSEQSNDHFIFYESWSPVSVYSHGGDDTFMFGSNNADANGTLAGFGDDVIKIGAGTGNDRIDINNQNYDADVDELSYSISEDAIYTFGGGFVPIVFNQAVDLVRVRGSQLQENSFSVTGSATTKFVIEGNSDDDRLLVTEPIDEEVAPEINDEIAGSEYGSVFFPTGNARQVFFKGIEDVSTSPQRFVSGNS